MPEVGMLVLPGFQFISLAAQTVFEIANNVAGERYYSLRLLSLDGGLVASSTGFRMETESLASVDEVDTLLLMAGTGLPGALGRDHLAHLNDHIRRARRTAGICTGAFLLAQAGVLDGRRATTHWYYARRMREDFPAILVEEDRIFINQGNIWTSAGLTAGLDLAVALVEQDLGFEVARSVSRKLVMHHRRAGGQSQHSELLDLAPRTDRIQTVLNYAKKNLSNPLTVEELAGAAALSPRQFSRAFRAATGRSPGKVVEQLRLEAARIMLEESRHPMEAVAQETGFGDPRRMREAFVRHYGQPPQVLRQQSRREADPAGRPRENALRQ
ncbi:GlxA family transcriptional regulator [Methylobacterium sp. 092160098-2]|uniref:GlxA family transcriptional regulator n=1 Tax=Methylobacterium sp. 092160098-2 TaxID=3025129 RepID=UPI002381C9D6|nr:GlxA family transcriptional regulator [Methylobacterium sp. 092160098-2]MDE4909204.1 GlxA family transcriptional regulator [Methylobacterium sp. 092160098-2]